MSPEQPDEPLIVGVDPGSDDRSSVVICSASGDILKMGDVITFSGVYVDPWWKRALRWLRILPKRADPPLQQFVVTWIDEGDPL